MFESFVVLGIIIKENIMKNLNIELGQKLGNKTITGICAIVNHGKYFPNTGIIARVAFLGPRNKKQTAYLHKDGTFSGWATNYAYFEGMKALDGTTSETIIMEAA